MWIKAERNHEGPSAWHPVHRLDVTGRPMRLALLWGCGGTSIHPHVQFLISPRAPSSCSINNIWMGDGEKGRGRLFATWQVWQCPSVEKHQGAGQPRWIWLSFPPILHFRGRVYHQPDIWPTSFWKKPFLVCKSLLHVANYVRFQIYQQQLCL